MKRLMGWWKAHPAVKTAIVAGVGAAVAAASNGMFGPKGVVLAGALTAIYGLFVKRPQDTKAEAAAAK